MIPGFNLDIKHKGKTFHIQTEDSGPQNPVIMTHLFLFGTILGTRRLEYGDALERPDLADHVRELMRAELREMHRALLAGDFDELARRPQKKAGATDIPLARRTGNQGPSLPPAAQSAPPGPASPVFTDENTALIPARLPDGSLVDAHATLDVDEVIDISDQAESVNDGPEGDVEALEGDDGSVLSDDLVSLVDEPTVVPPAQALTPPTGAAFQDRATLPARLSTSATPVRAPRANVEFPTDLVAEVRFDDVILAWLLEDVDEP